MKSGRAAARTDRRLCRKARARAAVGEFDFPRTHRSRDDGSSCGRRGVPTDGLRLFPRARERHGRAIRQSAGAEHGMPGYAVQWMEVEGPLSRSPRKTVDAGYRLLFGDLPMKIGDAGTRA